MVQATRRLNCQLAMGIKPDRQQVTQDWAARGFSCAIWTDPPGQVWADFVHAADELVMLIDGSIELRFSGRVLRPPPGVEVLIPAGVTHTVINTGQTTNHWFYGYKRN
jgi:quercetin dioxygenase-like cupin family protein